MTISDLIRRLEELRAEHGDVPVYVVNQDMCRASPLDEVDFRFPHQGLYGQRVAPYPVALIS